MNLRRLAEQMSRGVVLRRHLPKEFHDLPIYVTPEAGLRYWRALGKVDPGLWRMVRELVKPGSKVWDIGANVGMFGLTAAALSGPDGFVLAVEPDLWLANLLNRSAVLANKHRKSARIDVLCAAIAEYQGVCELRIAERSRASNHLAQTKGSNQADGVRRTQPSAAVTLDSLLDHFPKPNVLKIDVESAELEVLCGASRLLQTARPTVLCEVSKQNTDAVAALLHKNGYEIYEADRDPAERRPVDCAPWSTLAVPQQ